jgi:RHS repeat-associated protein
MIGTYKVKRYRPRIEGLFARIERWTDTSNGRIHWRSYSKDNVLSVYGEIEDARQSDPNDANRTFEWFLCYSCDDKGSVIRYIYQKEDFEGVSGLHERNHIDKSTQVYLKEVLYANKDPYQRGDALPESTDFLFKVVFDYGQWQRTESTVSAPVALEDSNRVIFSESGLWSVRQDPFSSCRGGFDIRTYRRCSNIFVFHCFDELDVNPCLVRSMGLTYQDEIELGQSGQTVEGFSFLTRLDQTGYKWDDNDETYFYKSMPAMEFEYQKHLWDSTIHTPDAAQMVHAPIGINDKQYLWIDLYSEGISGILTEQNGGWFYKENLGDGHFTQARQVSPKPSFSGLGGSLQIQELEANGIKYFVQQENVPKGFFKLSPDETWQNFRPFEQQLNIDMRQANARMVDLDGDGRSDLLITADEKFTWYPSAGERGFEVPFHVAREVDEEKGPAIVFSDSTQSILLADFNGDGLTDIVRIRNGEICYWPNLGYGKFGAKVSMSNAPLFDHPDGFSPSKIRLADVDGSGSTDLVYLDGRSFTIWINLNGNSFSTTPYKLSSLPQVDNLGEISVVDFLGTGTSCIVHSTPSPQSYGHPLRYIDLMGSKKPHLMTAYINNMGKRQEMEYASSTKFYLQDKQNGTPWVSKLPFPVHVLVKSITFDTVAQLRFASEYTYHHGYYDYAEREFRGFGRVDQLDTEIYDHFSYTSGGPSIDPDPVNQVPVLTKSWFHTGAFTDKDKILGAYSTEYYTNEEFEERHLPEARLLDEIGDPLLTNDFELRRQAARACKSMILRKEVYGLDGSLKESHPYAVEQHNCHIRLIQPLGNSKYAVFLPTESEAITYHYERNPEDPRCGHVLNLTYDQYGHVLQSLSVGYGRRVADPDLTGLDASGDQTQVLCVLTENSFTNDIDFSVNYRLKLPSQVITSEITGLQTQSGEDYFSIDSIIDQLSDPSVTSLNYDEVATSGVQKRRVEHLRSLYLKDDTTAALALGTMESKALPYESYKLAFTDDLFDNLFDTTGLTTTALSSAGYVEIDDLWWMPSGRPVLGSSHVDLFYMPEAFLDPFGNTTSITYDDYVLLMESVTDALGNETSVQAQDYRVLSPSVMRDVNDNDSHIAYDALGMPVAIALCDKSSTSGDSLLGLITELSDAALDDFFDNPSANADGLIDKATSRFVYRFSETPVSVATIMREQHYHVDPDSPLQLAFEYTGGLGQVILKKAQAEPGIAWMLNEVDALVEVDTTPNLRWVGSGRTILNNKGNPVKQYEPYFSATPAFENDSRLVETGVTPIIFYDPIGRAIRTELPNGTFTKVEFDAWNQFSFDPNDTVEDSEWFTRRFSGDLASNIQENDAALKAREHYNTPTWAVLDSLGRPVLSRAHNGFDGTDPDYLDTYTKLDIESQPLLVTDARGNTALSIAYNMCNVPSTQLHIDSGQRWLLANVINNPVWKKDAKGNVFTNTYDQLNRPLESIVDNGTTAITFQKIIYGETATLPKNLNLVGKPWKLYDGSGQTVMDEYDFKGSPLSTTKKFTEIYDTLPNWSASVSLESTSYSTTMEMDALGRPSAITTPDSKQTLYTYNQAGLLETVSVDDGTSVTLVVSNINYNEKGQRKDIFFNDGNFKTRYDYDPLTFQLKRLLSTKDTGSVILQDLNYTFDPVGNITWLKDDAQQNLFFNNYVTYPENKYTYDAIYRLIEATGREKFDNTPFYQGVATEDVPYANTSSPDSIQPYTRSFVYDPLGNILELQHAASVGSFNKMFDYSATNNQLQNVAIGATDEDFTYDAHGNQLASAGIDLIWNELDQLASADLGGGGTAYYNYDGQGQRTRKVIELSSGGKKIRKYIGSFEVYEEYDNSPTLTLQRETLHISDDTGRIAMLETRTIGTDSSSATLWRYMFSNHLQSATLELDENGDVISYEEYYPFGGTSYFASNSTINAVAKRYKYSGKEKDEETGLYYYGARYHAPWLCRFISVDPKALEYIYQGSFVFAGNNPIKYIDVNGEGPEDGIEDNLYTIQKGDNFWKIENMFGLKHGDLGRLNNSLNPNNLKPGTQIFLPSALSKPTKADSPSFSTSTTLSYTADKKEGLLFDQPRIKSPLTGPDQQIKTPQPKSPLVSIATPILTLALIIYPQPMGMSATPPVQSLNSLEDKKLKDNATNEIERSNQTYTYYRAMNFKEYNNTGGLLQDISTSLKSEGPNITSKLEYLTKKSSFIMTSKDKEGEFNYDLIVKYESRLSPEILSSTHYKYSTLIGGAGGPIFSAARLAGLWYEKIEGKRGIAYGWPGKSTEIFNKSLVSPPTPYLILNNLRSQ